ncbi:aquaporin 12 [Fundulus diaphanus]
MCHVFKQKPRCWISPSFLLFNRGRLSSDMSGLNASIGYFLSVVTSAGLVQALPQKWPRFSVLSELAASFMLVACWLEIQTIVEVGQWAGGLGQDVTVTMLFVLLLTHGVLCPGTSGNPSLAVQKFLQLEAGALPTALAVAAQFVGAHLALLAARYYWSLELTDMHMIKNLMWRECSTSLLVPVVQGFSTECACALSFHLIQLNLRRRSALIRVPLIAVLLTFFSHIARSYTSAFMNPSLAYGLTFHCPGFTFKEYAVVYWLSSLTGMTLALLLYMGHIPRLFARNLLYCQKTRFRVPTGDKSEKKKKK